MSNLLTSEEKNRIIREWLGMRWRVCGWHVEGVVGCFHFPAEDGNPDFYTSEDASALILEKMPCPKLLLVHQGSWECSPNWHQIDSPQQVLTSNPDRKTCIAEAALALIQRDTK